MFEIGKDLESNPIVSGAQGASITGESSSGVCDVRGTRKTCYTPIFPGESIGFKRSPAAVGNLVDANESENVKIQFSMLQSIRKYDEALELGANGGATVAVGATLEMLNNLDDDDFGGYAMTLAIELQPSDCNTGI